MNYSVIKKCDIADGPGVRVTLFVSGCTHHCEGCFQPETWNFSYGKLFDRNTEQELLEALRPDHIRGLTLLGGEPFEPDNQAVLLPFLRRVREACPKKDIWCYTGYRWEELMGMETGSGRARCEHTDEMLALIDVLVDGEFLLEKKNISLKFRGSENQRLIDLRKSEERRSVVWWE